MRLHGRMFALAAALALAGGCARVAPTFHAEGYPPRLSDWHVVEARGGRLYLNEGVMPYALNTALYTDYAHKLRTVWMPPGSAAAYDAAEAFDFPLGTIISKTFYYPRAASTDAARIGVARSADSGFDVAQGLDLGQFRLLETRLLVRRQDGWVALPYVWNAEQTDAVLARAGDSIALQRVEADGTREDYSYVVPDVNQCAGCHASDNTTRALHPIGPKARHLNRDNPYQDGARNQLEGLVAAGFLRGAPDPQAAPRAARLDDDAAPLDARARAYLDINCGHCHNPRGPADTSGLWLDAHTTEALRLGLCKPPVAAGQGTGDHKFDIVPGDPAQSILLYRMRSVDPGAMMPELGRATAHHEGVALIADWIDAWPGSCESVAATPAAAAP